jgi:hypothetical protein
MALHEGWHWLAARAAGVDARFGIDRRLYFLVFETDLSQLWTLPRNRRYGPQFAGLAIDSVVLAAFTGIGLVDRTDLYDIPDSVVSVAAALAYLLVAGMLWQCLVFLRTDLYAVLLTATGCHDLWNVKTLILHRAFGRLAPSEAERLAEARPRDVAVARWFRWVYLVGIPGTLAYFAIFYVPVYAELLAWTGRGLTNGPMAASFWSTLLTSAAVLWPILTVMATWVLDRSRGRTAAAPEQA